VNKHTPAPYTIDPGEYAGCTVYLIRETQGAENEETAQANAILWQAAPELLEALDALLQDADTHHGHLTQGSKYIGQARAAIAKAQG